MPRVFIPSLLRDLTNGRESLEVEGATVGEVIAALDHAYPGARNRLVDQDELRRGLAVVIDTEVAAQGLAQPVERNSEIHFLPAISGGEDR